VRCKRMPNVQLNRKGHERDGYIMCHLKYTPVCQTHAGDAGAGRKGCLRGVRGRRPEPGAHDLSFGVSLLLLTC
jgi:hypothetical protein